MRRYLDCGGTRGAAAPRRAWIHEEISMRVMIVVINIERKEIQISAMNLERREEVYHDATSSNVRFGSRTSDV